MRYWKVYDAPGDEMRQTLIAGMVPAHVHDRPDLRDALERAARERAASFIETIRRQIAQGKFEQTRMLARLAGSAALTVQSLDYEKWRSYVHYLALHDYGVTNIVEWRLRALYRAGHTWDAAAAVFGGARGYDF